MKEVILLLLIYSGGSTPEWHQHPTRFETVEACKARGRQIVAANFQVRKYVCQVPVEVQDNRFQDEE